jgi:hypothetical protein
MQMPALPQMADLAALAWLRPLSGCVTSQASIPLVIR